MVPVKQLMIEHDACQLTRIAQQNTRPLRFGDRGRFEQLADEDVDLPITFTELAAPTVPNKWRLAPMPFSYAGRLRRGDERNT